MKYWISLSALILSLSPSLALAAASTNLSFSFAPAGTHNVVVAMTEDAYQGDAIYSMSLDGVVVGTGTVTALHGTTPQNVSLVVPDGDHTLSITFTNDNYGGSPSLDRNLYVESVSYDGRIVISTETSLLRAGDTFSTPIGPLPPPTITLNVTPSSVLLNMDKPQLAGTVIGKVTITMSDGSTFTGTMDCGTVGSPVCAAAPFISLSGTDLKLNRDLGSGDIGNYMVTITATE